MRHGEIVAPVVFFLISYFTITVICILGTGSGLQFYYVVAAAIVLVVLGVDHIIWPRRFRRSAQ